MKRVALQWTYSADIINVPDTIAENINDYQRKFDQWLYDKNNQHGYWATFQSEEGSSTCVMFGSEAFINWLNDYILAEVDEKVIFELKDIQLSDKYKALPLIYFRYLMLVN